MMRRVLVFVLACGAVATAGCSTIVRPTKPDAPMTAMGAPLRGVRFDGEATRLREPGMPLSPSRLWTREVQNYTAASLNTLLSADDAAPAASTIVTFDMASPSAIQIGTWKELSITMTTTLPDGSVVRSAPVTGPIDDPLEYAAMTAASVGSTVMNVAGSAALVLFFATQPRPDPSLGIVAVGSLVGSVVLSAVQSGGQYLVAAAEEKRWSNLFARALTHHAADIRRGGTSPLLAPPAGSAVPSFPTRVPDDPSDVPPLLNAPP